MVRKKKQWIDKKKASTFRVVHRSMQDPLWGDANRSDLVLEPVPNLNQVRKGHYPPTIEEAERIFFPSSTVSESQFEDEDDDLSEGERGTIVEETVGDGADLLPLESYGFPDDGYDYAKHLKPMGGGTFISVEEASGHLFGLPPVLEDVESRYVPGGSEAFLPPDVLAQLEGDFSDNDLQDDWMAAADEEMSDEYEDLGEMPPPLEYDEFEGSDDENWTPQDEFAKGQKDKSRKLVYVSKLKNFDSMLDKQFDEMAHEFDDDEIGELDEEDPSVQGVMNLSELDYVLDEFLQDQPLKPLKKSNRAVPEDLADRIHATTYEPIDLQDDSEDDNLEGYEYLSSFNEPRVEQFDCESILSTYSNLYNHPTVIGDTPKKKITLSKRSGLPVGYVGLKKEESNDFVLPEDEESDEEEFDAQSTVSTNLGERRPKKETAAEKAERKRLVKEMRKTRREQKKQNRLEFKTEEVRQLNAHIATKNPTGIRL